MTSRTRAKSATSATRQKDVDMEVLTTVLEAARKRLELVRKTEQDEMGAAQTTLAYVARRALHNWTPPASIPEGPQPRALRNGADVSAFRFTMPRNVYDQKRDAIRATGQSVASVVQEGLRQFALHGVDSLTPERTTA